MQQQEFTREEHPNFYKLWDLKCTKDWYNHEIYATTTKDLEMSVWNGNHPPKDNVTEHTCKAGTKVRVWMVSRFGDVGVTDNLESPKGYDVRGLDADVDLKDYEFIKKK